TAENRSRAGQRPQRWPADTGPRRPQVAEAGGDQPASRDDSSLAVARSSDSVQGEGDRPAPAVEYVDEVDGADGEFGGVQRRARCRLDGEERLGVVARIAEAHFAVDAVRATPVGGETVGRHDGDARRRVGLEGSVSNVVVDARHRDDDRMTLNEPA